MKTKYVTVQNQTALELRYQSFHVTKEGELLCVSGSSIVRVIKAGQWFRLEKEARSFLARKNPAYMLPRKLSPELQLVVRAPELVRTEIIKRLWAFIKKNRLQDTKNRRLIHVARTPETKLLFKGKKTINMFEMTKLLDKHIS